MKHCNWCDIQFETKISYQIYCSITCREEATKEKIASRYIQIRRQKRKGKDRRCQSCDGLLSIYNDEPLCMTCQINPKDVTKTLKQIKGMMNGKE